MSYLMTHTARNGRKVSVTFPSLKAAQLEAYRWRRSPKTLRVGLPTYTPDPKLDLACAEAIPALRAEQQSWFQVWHYEATRAWNTFRYFIHNLNGA